MSRHLTVRNRQRSHRLDLGLLKQIATELLEVHLQLSTFNIGFCVVGQAEMTRINEQFLRHAGCTDVITFDYTEPRFPSLLAGEVVVCVEEARQQARRFRTTWQSELVRYVVHGTLHLSGYDDRRAEARRRMKSEENRLLKELRQRFAFACLGRPRRSPSKRKTGRTGLARKGKSGRELKRA